MDAYMTLDGNQVKVNISHNQLSWQSYFRGITKTDTLPSKVLLTSKVYEAGNKSQLRVVFVKILLPTDVKILARKDHMTFIGTYENCQNLHEQLTNLISLRESHRPKRLLVFINPRSGSHRGVQIYYNIVLPLLEECGIQSHSIVTQSKTHAAEFLVDYDLSDIDAVVCIGGDGSFRNVVNGLILKTRRDFDLEFDESAPEIKPKVPVMPLPAGSGSVMSLYAGGALDVETCTIALILGNTTPLDIIGVRSNGRNLGYGMIVLGSGVFTNVYVRLEQLRMFGEHRYWMVLPLAWYTHTHYDLQITFKPAKKDSDSFRLVPSVEKSADDDDKFTFSDGPEDGWKTLLCKSCETGIMPLGTQGFMNDCLREHYHTPDFAKGKLLLGVFKYGSVWNHLWAFEVLMHKGNNHVPPKYVEYIEAMEVKIKAVGDHSDKAWADTKLGLIAALDGEAERLDCAEYHVILHGGLVDMFCLDPTLVSEARAGHLQ